MHDFNVSSPWAIQPEYLMRLCEVADAHARTATGAPQSLAARGGLSDSPMVYVTDGVAVIDLVGPLTKGYSWVTAMFGGTSMVGVGALIDQAVSDPTVKGILLNIDSPGGSVDGTEGLVGAIRRAGEQKPVVSLASGTMASAAYWAGSAAGAVYLDSGTTIVGSIGVVSRHVDISGLESRIGIKTTEITAGKFKRIASMHEPLSAEGRGSIQAQLDHIYSIFVHAVADHRRAPVQTVLDRMADGRVFIGQQAVDAGLVDGFSSRGELIARLRTGGMQATKPQPTRKVFMSDREIRQAAFDEVGPHGSSAQYQAAMKRISAGSGSTEPSCPVTGLTADEKLQKAKAYADAHGVDLVQALKALGYAK